MISRIVRLILTALISAAIGISPISVMAADPAPAPTAAPAEAPADKVAEKKAKKKVKKEKTKEDENLEMLARNLELSQREIKLYKEHE